MAVDTTIKKGYKKTELGVIPEDWDIKKLGKIGHTYGGLSGKTKNDFDKGKYPYIPFMNIMSNSVVDLDYFDYVNIRSDENQNKAMKGDLFFNGSSETPDEVGLCSVLRGDVPNLYLNSFCFGFRLNKDLITDGLYISYLFRSPFGRKLIYSLAQGATRYNLSKTNFLKLDIPYPKPAEQTAIATVLSDTDALIERLEKLIAKKKAIKQGAMQQLLTGKKRLPGFSGEWETRKIGDIFRVTRGQVLSMTKTTSVIMGEHQYPVYSSQTKNNGLAGYYTSYLFEDCITWTTDGANAGEVKHRKGKFYCTNVCGVLESKDGYSNMCIAAIFNSVSRNYVSYVGNPKLMNNVVANIELRIPKLIEEQMAISVVLSDMDIDINRLEQKLAKYNMLKQGMMQQLLTGKIRIYANK